MTSNEARRPHWGRRRLLQAGAVALGGAGTGWSAATATREGAAGSAADGATSVSGSSATTAVFGGQVVPFHGPHQAGVATTPQAHVSLLGLDLATRDRETLRRVLLLLSDDAARLTQGLPALADTEPELAGRPARLSVTFGLGPEVMAEVLGRPDDVRPLPSFSIDQLDPGWGQTDLLIQICSDDPLTIAHTRRMLLKDAAGLASLTWVQDGFGRANGTVPSGTTMRNLMGQVDGTVNPDEADPEFPSLIWSQADGMVGGTTMVLRRIRMELDTWDRVEKVGKEASVGRTLATGAPLTGSSEFDEPDFEATDDLGFPVIAPASHVARSHARNDREHFLRRGYNYLVPDPAQPLGEDAGLLFIAFAADLEEQFVPVQQRLAEEDLLNEWTIPIGSAVYTIPPGATQGEYVGQALIEGAR